MSYLAHIFSITKAGLPCQNFILSFKCAPRRSIFCTDLNANCKTETLRGQHKLGLSFLRNRGYTALCMKCYHSVPINAIICFARNKASMRKRISITIKHFLNIPFLYNPVHIFKAKLQIQDSL